MVASCPKSSTGVRLPYRMCKDARNNRELLLSTDHRHMIGIDMRVVLGEFGVPLAAWSLLIGLVMKTSIWRNSAPRTPSNWYFAFVVVDAVALPVCSLAIAIVGDSITRYRIIYPFFGFTSLGPWSYAGPLLGAALIAASIENVGLRRLSRGQAPATPFSVLLAANSVVTVGAFVATFWKYWPMKGI